MSTSNNTKRLLDADAMNSLFEEIAKQINDSQAISPLALVGIRTRGEFVARRLQAILQSGAKTVVPMGILDVSFYRDDTRAKLKQPVVQSTDIPFDLTGKRIVLVDDVLFTGRSVRAAMDELMDFGRPARIELAVLIDRGFRELPIQADFVGKKIEAPLTHQVRVRLKEYDDTDEVVLLPKL